MILDPGDTRLTSVLAAMLGVTRAVARRAGAPPLLTGVSLQDGVLDLSVEAQAPIDAELYALERPARRLESALGCPVRVVGRTLPDRRLAELA
jgi:hypothetical protein